MAFLIPALGTSVCSELSHHCHFQFFTFPLNLPGAAAQSRDSSVILGGVYFAVSYYVFAYIQFTVPIIELPQ